MLAPSGHIKLTDFGISKEDVFQGDVTSTFCGTADYLSPEVIDGMSYDHSVDWWALGIILYIFLTGMVSHRAAVPQ